MKNQLDHFDDKSVDHTIRPQDNFYQHVNNKSVENVELPHDLAFIDTLSLMQKHNTDQLLQIIHSLMSKCSTLNNEQIKIINFYNSFMKKQDSEQLNLNTLSNIFQNIVSIKRKDELIKVLAKFNTLSIKTPFAISVIENVKKHNEYIFTIKQDGLTLPNKAYYSSKDSKFRNLQNDLKLYLNELISIVELNHSTGDDNQIIPFEIELAQHQWHEVDCKDLEKTYNLLTYSEFQMNFPHIDWDLFFSELNISPPKELIIQQPDYLQYINKLLENPNIEVWKSYLKVKLLDEFAQYLPNKFDKLHFNFHHSILKGIKIKPKPETQVIKLINTYLSDALGKEYIKAYYSQAQQEQIQELIENLIHSYAKILPQLNWFTSETKHKALDKLHQLTINIGYPKQYKGYEQVNILETNLIQNIINLKKHQFNTKLNRLNHKVNLDEWDIPAQVVNANYNPNQNCITLPAGILQSPLFDHTKSAAQNYGAIGAIICHEISHAFDDQGSKFNASGILSNWWSESDKFSFEKLQKVLIEQFNQYSPLNGYYVNGQLTVGENIADLMGVFIALQAFKNTPDFQSDSKKQLQEFFKSWAKVWWGRFTEQELIYRLNIDTHAPHEYRVNGILANISEFYQVYDIHKNDKMFIDQKNRIFP